MLLIAENNFACYSLPGSTNFELIQGKVTKLPITELPNSKGFLIAEFANNSQAYFISSETQHTNPNFKFDATSGPKTINSSKSTYLRLCDDYINLCQLNLDKIVLSRIKTIPYLLNTENLFHAFRKTYPNAFVYLINSPEFGTWIGATPEVLLKRNVNKYVTMALAGTKKATDKTTWSRKEENEQQLVSDFITQKMNQLKIDVNSIGPSAVTAGNVQHLCTEFNFTTKIERGKIINALHPTPAVCGLPPKEAKEKLLTSEPHSRELYTGFLGPINFDNTDFLFVNLRCLKANQKKLHLFAGGGITSDSQSINEWEETELKMETLLGVIEKL